MNRYRLACAGCAIRARRKYERIMSVVERGNLPMGRMALAIARADQWYYLSRSLKAEAAGDYAKAARFNRRVIDSIDAQIALTE